MFHCKPKMTAPIVHPTKCCVKNLYSTTEVSHIHPSHTTYVNNQMFQHKHYYPHTQSMVDSVSHQDVYGGPGAPGQVMGAMDPGMYGAPGQVMGAMDPGMYGAPGQVMGTMDPGMYGAPSHVMGVNQPYRRK